jgi:outer membrane protein assembly factor BamA
VPRFLALLSDAGRFDARVRLSWTADPGGGAPRDFQVAVEEGPAARFGAVTHTGADSLDGRVLSRVTPPRAGAPFERGDLERHVDALLDLYDEAGFPYARIVPESAGSPGDSVTVRLRHEPGPRVFVSAVELRGATLTRPRTVERLMRFRPGRPYRQSELEAGLLRLERSGLFAAVGAADLVPGDDPARSRVRLTVREAASGSLAGIAGYSGRDRRLSGYLDFRLHNIAGTARRLEARWSAVEKASTDYLLAYREPFLFGRPLDASIRLAHTVFDTIYTATRTDLALHWRPGGRTEVTGTLGSDRVIVTAGVRRAESSGRLGLGVVHDARRSRPAPDGGALLGVTLARGRTLSGTFGDAADAGLAEALTLDVRAELYRAVGRRTVLALLVTARSLETDARPVPRYELFRLGGAATLRGYREEQFYTPGFTLGQLELRLLSGAQGSGAFLFVDGAAFTAETGPATLWPDFGEFELGYGAGLRLGSRLGKVGVDYGLAAGEGPLDGRIHVRAETDF